MNYVYKKIIFLSHYKLYMSGRFFENEPDKICSPLSEKRAKRQVFFAPDKLDKSHQRRQRKGGKVTLIPILRPTLILAQPLDGTSTTENDRMSGQPIIL